jgi:hypothetical protein
MFFEFAESVNAADGNHVQDEDNKKRLREFHAGLGFALVVIDFFMTRGGAGMEFFSWEQSPYFGALCGFWFSQ